MSGIVGGYQLKLTVPNIIFYQELSVISAPGISAPRVVFLRFGLTPCEVRAKAGVLRRTHIHVCPLHTES